MITRDENGRLEISLKWKLDDEKRSASGTIFDPQFALMAVDDAPRDRQTEPRSIRFGGEEGCKDLLLEIPIKRQESIVESIRRAVKSLANVIDIIKIGFKPDLSTTWWIILGLIAFLMIMSASFYVIWISKLKETKVVKKKGKEKNEPKAAPAPAATKQAS